MSKTPLSFPVAIVILLVILGASAGLYQSFHPANHTVIEDIFTKRNNTVSTVKTNLTLPPQWSFINEDNTQSDLKIERTSAFVYKPTIVLIQTEVYTEDEKDYVDRLIKGAKVSLSSLTITTDKEESTKNIYTRNLSGTFFIAYQKMNIDQVIIIKDNILYTLTGISQANEFPIVKQETADILTHITPLLTH